MRLNLTVWIDCAFLRSKVRVQRHRRCVFHWLIRILQSSSQFRRMSKWWINSPLSNLCQRTKKCQNIATCRTWYSPNLMSILLNKRGQNVVLMSWRVSLKVCFNNTLRETQKTVAFAKCAILWYLAFDHFSLLLYFSRFSCFRTLTLGYYGYYATRPLSLLYPI